MGNSPAPVSCCDLFVTIRNVGGQMWQICSCTTNVQPAFCCVRIVSGWRENSVCLKCANTASRVPLHHRTTEQRLCSLLCTQGANMFNNLWLYSAKSHYQKLLCKVQPTDSGERNISLELKVNTFVGKWKCQQPRRLEMIAWRPTRWDLNTGESGIQITRIRVDSGF